MRTTLATRLLLALAIVVVCAIVVYVLFTTVFPWVELYFEDPSLSG